MSIRSLPWGAQFVRKNAVFSRHQLVLGSARRLLHGDQVIERSEQHGAIADLRLDAAALSAA
jgi:hypothetical protein